VQGTRFHHGSSLEIDRATDRSRLPKRQRNSVACLIVLNDEMPVLNNPTEHVGQRSRRKVSFAKTVSSFAGQTIRLKL
jgi:hypothetical protein